MGDAESEGGMSDTDKDSFAPASELAIAFLLRHVSMEGMAAARRDLVEYWGVAYRAGFQDGIEKASEVPEATQSGGGG